MKKKFIPALCCLILLAGASAASADTIGGQGQSGYDVSFGAPTAIPWNADLSIKQFDSSLGTLTNIYLVFSGNNESTSTLSNPVEILPDPPSGPLSWYSATAIARIKLLNPSDNSTQLLLITPTVSNTTGGTLADGESINITGTGQASKFANLTPGSTGFSNFIGAGNVTLKTTASGSGSADMDMGLEFAPSGLADENLYVVYTYTPESTVPEPGTFMLFGAGLIGAGAFLRLRRKQ